MLTRDKDEATRCLNELHVPKVHHQVGLVAGTRGGRGWLGLAGFGVSSGGSVAAKEGMVV